MAKPIYIYTGTEWVPVGPQIGNIAYNWIYTATGSETSLSGTDDNGLTLSYTPNYEQVYLNGVLLTRGTDYTTASSSSITGLSALTSGDVINVLVLETTTVDNTYTQNQVDVLATDLRNEQVAINQFGAAGSSLLNLPSQVHPAEKLLKQAVWYIDSAHESAGNQEISNLGWGGNALNAQSGSTTGEDSNDPKFLGWEGENYVYLPGVDGNTMTVPHEAALDITGDIDIRIYASLDWQGTTQAWLVSKATVFSQETFSFYKHTVAGQFRFECGDGSSSPAVTSAAVSFSDGDAGWIRVTRDQTGGEVKFYESTDGASWTLLNTVTGFTTTAGFSNSIDVAIGSRATSTLSSAIEAKVYRAQILDGIDGTPVLDVDTSQISSGSDTSFPALTGQTVSINRSTSGRKSVAVTHPVWLFGTDDYMEVADNDLIDFGVNDDFTVLALVRQWETVGTEYILAKKEAASTAVGYGLLTTSTLVLSRVSDGTESANTSISNSMIDLGVIAIARDAGATVDIYGHGDSSSATDDLSSSLSNSLPLRIGYTSSGTAYAANMEFIAAAVFRRTLTESEIQTLTNYFNGRTGG